MELIGVNVTKKPALLYRKPKFLASFNSSRQSCFFLYFLYAASSWHNLLAIFKEICSFWDTSKNKKGPKCRFFCALNILLRTAGTVKKCCHIFYFYQVLFTCKKLGSFNDIYLSLSSSKIWVFKYKTAVFCFALATPD